MPAAIGSGATGQLLYIKGLTIMVNSVFSGWRTKEVRLDK